MRKLVFGMHINIEVFYKLIVSFWVSVTRYVQITQNKKFVYLCNISRKARGVNLIFCRQINTKVFYKLILGILGIKVSCNVILSLMGMIKYSQTIQSQIGMEFICCMQININVSASLYYPF